MPFIANKYAFETILSLKLGSTFKEHIKKKETFTK
jgi:hypothetical protein